jgi:hypothetical protein
VPVWISRQIDHVNSTQTVSAQDAAYWYQTQITPMTTATIPWYAASHPAWTNGTTIDIWRQQYRPTWYWSSSLQWESEDRLRRAEVERAGLEEQRAYHAALAACNSQEAGRLEWRIAARERETAAARNREALARRLAEEERERRGQADQRARGLLLEHLTPEQRETFEDNGWFVVEGGESGTLYRIRNQGSMIANVEVLNPAGCATHRLCAHVPVGQVPMGDQLLAQKMMLEFSESHFLRIANRH